MELAEVIADQAHRDMGFAHLVYVHPRKFCLAHTDEERARGENTETCDVHAWLAGHAAAPAEPGLYVVVPYQPDLYSESYPVPSYELLSAEFVDPAALRAALTEKEVGDGR